MFIGVVVPKVASGVNVIRSIWLTYTYIECLVVTLAFVSIYYSVIHLSWMYLITQRIPNAVKYRDSPDRQ